MTDEKPSYVGVRKIPIMDRSGDEPKEVGWAHVDEDGNIIDQDITDPDTIRKLQEKALHSYGFTDEKNKGFVLGPVDGIPDTFKR